MHAVATPIHEPWKTVRYRAGFADAGGRGRFELTLWNDRLARVAFLGPGRAEVVRERSLLSWVLPELFEHLRGAGFPAFSDRVATTSVRTALLSVGGAGETLQAWITPGRRETLPGLDRAVLLLEGVAHALSDGALAVYRALERPVLVTGPVSASAPARPGPGG